MNSFTATPRRSGEATILTIPRQYVSDGHLKEGIKYRFNFEEAADDAE